MNSFFEPQDSRKSVFSRSAEKTPRGGFTLFEILLVVGIAAILGGIMIVMLFSQRNVRELNDTARKIAAALRESQSSAAVQKFGTQWGVLFNNTSTPPYFAIFSGASPDPSTTQSQNPLPERVRYYDPANNYSKSVAFSQITGTPVDPYTGLPDPSFQVIIQLQESESESSTITVLPTGAIAYNLLECSIVYGCQATTVVLPPGGPQQEDPGTGGRIRRGGGGPR